MALWQRFLTPELITQIQERASQDVFFLVELADLERRLEERVYGRCEQCGHVNSWNGVCYDCLGKRVDAQIAGDK